MKRILLACSAGMSTSLLVTKMEKAALDRNLDVKIWAIPESSLSDEVSNCDVVLLGPQVRFVLNRATEIAKPYNVPVEVINMMHYGTCNGEEVLNRALELCK